MKPALRIFGILIFLSGLVWFLQGINLLPGSYMTGDPQWTVNGFVATIAGAGMFFLARRND